MAWRCNVWFWFGCHVSNIAFASICLRRELLLVGNLDLPQSCTNARQYGKISRLIRLASWGSLNSGVLVFQKANLFFFSVGNVFPYHLSCSDQISHGKLQRSRMSGLKSSADLARSILRGLFLGLLWLITLIKAENSPPQLAPAGWQHVAEVWSWIFGVFFFFLNHNVL